MYGWLSDWWLMEEKKLSIYTNILQASRRHNYPTLVESVDRFMTEEVVEGWNSESVTRKLFFDMLKKFYFPAAICYTHVLLYKL